MPWTRPASVPVGQVWSRFKGREKDGQPAKMYQIRDIDDQNRQKCLDLMTETFLKEEPISEALGTLDDPVSTATEKAGWEVHLEQGVSLACFTELDGEADELVGVNIMLVKSRDDEKLDIDQVQGETLRKLLITMEAVKGQVDVFSLYGVDQYLTSNGLTVRREHRGQNIGAEMIKARKPLCRAVGLEATATVFTALASQGLAHKCGYEQLAELRYADMAARGIDLSACTAPSAKLMAINYTFD